MQLQKRIPGDCGDAPRAHRAHRDRRGGGAGASDRGALLRPLLLRPVSRGVGGGAAGDDGGGRVDRRRQSMSLGPENERIISDTAYI